MAAPPFVSKSIKGGFNSMTNMITRLDAPQLRRLAVRFAVLGAFLVSVSGPAMAEAMVSGHVTATPNTEEPELGAWKYCLELVWDTGSDSALVYFDLDLALEQCGCVCEDLIFGAQEPAGETTAGLPLPTPPCTVSWTAEFLCEGDDEMGLDAPVVRFDPIDDGCVPEATGYGTVCFFTDWAPVEVVTPNDYLAILSGGEVIHGEITGELPGCDCPTPAEGETWGWIKTQFK